MKEYVEQGMDSILKQIEIISSQQRESRIILNEIKDRLTPKQSKYMNSQEKLKQMAFNLVNGIK